MDDTSLIAFTRQDEAKGGRGREETLQKVKKRGGGVGGEISRFLKKEEPQDKRRFGGDQAAGMFHYTEAVIRGVTLLST